MPVIDFYLRTPGQHRILERITLDATPRVGELVELDGETRLVHEVLHQVAINVTRVLLKE